MAANRIVPYGPDDSQFVELWPATGDPIGSAMLIHGGYWRDRYGLDLMHPMAAHLASNGWTVANIEYRRLTEAQSQVEPVIDPHGARYGAGDVWPAMASDVLEAIGAAGSSSPRPAVVIGHSAGGHLALWAASRGPAVDGVVALAPVADLVGADRLELSGGVIRRLLGADSATAPDLYAAASPLALVPIGVPQLIVHGSTDENVPPSMAVEYAAAAGAAGDHVELLTPEGVDHFHIIDPDHDAWRPIDRWLTEVAGSGRLRPGRGV